MNHDEWWYNHWSCMFYRMWKKFSGFDLRKPSSLPSIAQIWCNTTPQASFSGFLPYIVSAIPLRLRYEVRRKSEKGPQVIEDIVTFIKAEHPKDSGIVYCFSKYPENSLCCSSFLMFFSLSVFVRKETDMVAAELVKHGIKAAAYHADHQMKARESTHTKWSLNHINVSRKGETKKKKKKEEKRRDTDRCFGV